jgi:steroid 5-alpha reductase family enzyme
MIAIVTAALMLILPMTAAWLMRMRGAASGWIDVIWSAAVGIAGLSVLLLADTGDAGRRWLIAGLLGLWSTRLVAHIAARTIGSSDDPRYAALAREWGDTFPFRLFMFLQAQALAGLMLAAAIYLAAANPKPFPGALDIVGALVIVAAILGEALADAQLQRFRRMRRPGQTVCDTGLWGWSRHPNYFFEWLGWVGFALLAVDPAGGYPLGFLAFTAPLLMYGLLVHVSGIPPLEAHMLASRGEAFRRYQQRVSAFFPVPPRSHPRSTAQGAGR